MPHLTSREARRFDLHGVTFNAFVSSATGATRLAAWRTDFAPATPGQPHVMSEEEVLYVVAGDLDVEIDGEAFTSRSGDAVLVPAGAVFRASNSADRPAQAWATTLVGMTASMSADGEQLAPPWAQ